MCDINVTWQPRRVDWNVYAWTVSVVDAIEWACVLCGCTFKVNEQVEQKICIEFCVKLEHSSVETIWMIQKVTAMGNWWFANSLWQCSHSCIMSHAEFWAKHQITQVTYSPYSPYFMPCSFWLFPKLKSPLKGKRFRPSVRFTIIWQGSCWQLGELCEVPRCLLLRGLRHRCPPYNVSCILYLLQ